jgi:shikimate dehydrogenase
MPLKRSVVPLLARVERNAADLGVVNTVLFGGQEGLWWGTNTDVTGIVAALHRAGCEAARSGVAWVIGAGATAASAVAALAQLGIRTVVVVARRREAAGALAELGLALGIDVELRDWASLRECTEADLVVAAVPAGATDELATGLPPPVGLLFDVLYDPWPTPLAAAWERGGGAVVGGLELLVEQAAEQVRLMTGQPPPVDAMRAAGQAALAARAID